MIKKLMYLWLIIGGSIFSYHVLKPMTSYYITPSDYHTVELLDYTMVGITYIVAFMVVIIFTLLIVDAILDTLFTSILPSKTENFAFTKPFTAIKYGNGQDSHTTYVTSGKTLIPITKHTPYSWIKVETADGWTDEIREYTIMDSETHEKTITWEKERLIPGTLLSLWSGSKPKISTTEIIIRQ